MVSNLNSQPPLPGGAPLPPPGGLTDGFGGAKVEEDALNLRHALSVLWRRWWLLLLVSAAVTTTVTVRVLNEPPTYRSQFRLLVEPIASDERFDRFSERLLGQLGLQLDYSTQIEVLTSPEQLAPKIAAIQDRYPELDYGTLMNGLYVGRVPETKIIEVSYQDSDPQKIQYVLENIAAGYIAYSQREQRTGNRKGLEFVEGQLPQLESRVDELQAELQAFQQQHDLLNPNLQGEAASNRLNQIREARAATETELKEARTLQQKLDQQLQLELDQAVTLTALSEAPRYQALLNELQKIETQIALESARFTPASPTMQALRDRRDNLLPLLRREAIAVLGPEAATADAAALAASPNQIRLDLTKQLIETTNREQTLSVRSAALALAEVEARRQVQTMAALSREHTDLERRLEVATDSLNRFLSVQEDLQIEAAQQGMAWELLLAPEISYYPIAPDVPRGILLGAVAGLLAGIGAALIAEKLDVRFHSPEDLKDTIKLPLLGVVPYRKDFKARRGGERAAPLPLPVPGGRRYRASPFLEAFRSLNANLSFLTPDKPLKALVISSSVPLEGKSTTAVHLAQAAAAMGQRVLLVDADLRRPQVHAMTDLPNVWGLSHAISMDIEVDDLIQRSPLDDNLFILTSGQIPPDPTRLLSSQKMRSLTEHFRQQFDLVVFDTPPLLGLADAKFLAAQVDVMLLVARLGWTDRTLLKQAIEGLNVGQVAVTGLIANGAKNYRSGSYYYYHRYFSSDSEPDLADRLGGPS